MDEIESAGDAGGEPPAEQEKQPSKLAEAGVIQVWLVTTLVELIGVALVITRYLFPRRDRQTTSP